MSNKIFKEAASHKLERAAIWTLRASVFLFPSFVLPFPSLPLESMKAHFIIISTLIVLALTVASAIFSSKYIIRMHRIIYGLAAILLISIFSAFLGESRLTSFWGLGGREMWSVLTIFGIVMLGFLIGTLHRSRSDIEAFIFSLGLGLGLANVLELFQLAGRFAYPFAFTHQRIWSSLGTPKVFAFFSSVGIIIMMIYLRISSASRRQAGKIFALGAILICVWTLLRIDFYGAWLFLALSALLYYLSCFWIAKRHVFWDKYLPLSIFIVSLVFTMVGSPLRQNLIPEFNLDTKTSLQVTGEALRGNLFLGSGPGTFEFAFSRFRPASFNSGNFWNVRFDRPERHLIAILATTGILGLLSFFAPFVFLFWALWRAIKTRARRDPLPYLVGSLAVLAFLTPFFYVSNLVFLWYVGLTLGLSAALFGEDREIYNESQKYKFIGLGILTVILVTLLRLGIFEVSAISGEAALARSLNLSLSPEARYQKMETALRFNKNEPRILRAFSKAALQYANELGRIRDPDGAKIQKLLEDSTSLVKRATVIEPRDVENWLALGAVYQNLLPFVEGSGEWVVRAYSEALLREPSNPLPHFEMGKSYLTLGDRMKSEGIDKDLVQRIYQRAEEELIKALNLKADYAPIHFYLGLIYSREGREDDALKKLLAVEKFNPSDVGVAYELGLLYLKQGNLPKAKVEFSRAVSNLPSFSDARWQLANVLLRQGQPSEAISELKKILQYNPDNQNVIKAIEEIKLGRTRL